MMQDEYSLPSMYSNTPAGITRKSPGEDSEDSLEDPNDLLADSSSPLRGTYRDHHNGDNQLAWLMLWTALSMLLMTVIPVLADIPDINPWFNGNTLWRLFDPVITLPLNLFVITRADVMVTGGRSRNCGFLSEQSIGWLLWAIGAGIYVQGHGMHTAAALFKHPIEDFNLAHPELVTQYPILHEMYLNMEDLWEHKIAHYMYAFGGMWMSWAQIYVFRNQVHGPLPKFPKIVWALGSFIYGLLLAGVAIEFPAGLIVGLVYTTVIGSICVATILLNKRSLPHGGLLTMGRRMVPQYYLGSCVVGLIIIIGWLGKYGFKNRKESGVAT
ncbi:hypothetical protein J3Q64DRAFT_1719061 [Phycomyces blakesleeanus]|uniref:Uncharacterized protein n=2 Tax=Phycomyces blakesleeanus TaxID=4837 RepID=A0A163EGU2_PHYB8|nr:hypothetical protein PHYBLDRAFT_140640 [Phycomyces blakesleeanus NRRL 1555(-)]OAD78570.1 hypothetical protein PHYBLDRAFT_140640 [Phycomyces blakesleeanus NRRL 1555(-)]|eukprot:XP_018296610.1 hypothetical protein PHYBLDRAFT_140640 [Phycomyces blakesleeanus NRRL 1555(-)]